MSFCVILTGELLLIAACVICGNFAQTPCTTDGWFGPNCQYQCHCANSSSCDKVDGSCSSGCDLDWFGPACQYDRATFTASSGLWWLTDLSDTTCNTGSSQSVTVDLNTAIPLTWVRVVLNDAAYLNQIVLNYNAQTSPSFQSCTDNRTAKVNNVTLDIYCPTDMTVDRITLSGRGVTKLCAFYISGGRNVALKQPTQQSSRYEVPGFPGNNFFFAHYAVDGRVSDGSLDSTRLTCTHTDTRPSPDWWTVNFTQAVDIIRFSIYNKKSGNNIVRLIGFTLTAQPEYSTTAIPYTYTDRQPGPQVSYLIVPSSKISFPVSQVRVEAGPTSEILTLCEVFVFGEFHCPSGTFGLSCERQCNCAGGGRTCFVHNGGCPDGCATNYYGEDCYALQQSEEPGEFGLNIWGISVTIVAAAAVIVIGLLLWRLVKCAKERSSTLTNNGIVEEDSQRPGQQGITNINRPTQRYDNAQVGLEDVNLYSESFDHYDSPLDLVRRTGNYETPRLVVITDSNQDYVEADIVPSVGGSTQSSGDVSAL